MNRIITVSLITLALNAFFANERAIAQSVEKRVAEIRKLYSQVNKDATAGEEGYSALRSDEIVIGKLHGPPRRAIGELKGTYTFLYYDEDVGTEKDIYKRRIRLAKIIVSWQRGSGRDYSEYLLNEKGSLVFFYNKSAPRGEPIETRYYYDDNGNLARAQFGKDEIIDKPDEALQRGAGSVLSESLQLKKMFEQTHKE